MMLSSFFSAVTANCVEYHSGEPFKWKFTTKNTRLFQYSGNSTLCILDNFTYYGFDGYHIIEFVAEHNGQYTTQDGKIYHLNAMGYVEPVGATTNLAPGNCPVTGPSVFKTEYAASWVDESGATPNKPFCSHSWKEYNGFTENYKFCEKCDKKDLVYES